MRRRVAVTGMGVICPIGNSPDEFRENLLLGVCGVGLVTLFDPASLPTRIAAEVKWRGPILRARKITFAIEAVEDALDCSGLPLRERVISLVLVMQMFAMDNLATCFSPGFAVL